MQGWAGLRGGSSQPLPAPGAPGAPGVPGLVAAPAALTQGPTHGLPFSSERSLGETTPNPGWPHLKSLLKSTWKTLFLNKLEFRGSGWAPTGRTLGRGTRFPRLH